MNNAISGAEGKTRGLFLECRAVPWRKTFYQKKKAERSSRLANREGQKDGLIGGFSKDDPCMLCKLRFQCLRNDHSPDSTHLKCTQESESLSHCPCLAFTYPTQY